MEILYFIFGMKKINNGIQRLNTMQDLRYNGNLTKNK